MCDIEPKVLVAEFRKAEASFKPLDVLNWNGMSWDYMTMALVGEGISDADRRDMATFARKALTASAILEKGVKSLAWVFSRNRRNKPIEAMASTEGLPPEPTPYAQGRMDIGGGRVVEVARVMDDPYRTQRRRAITANVLLRLEKNPAWRPSADDMRGIFLRAGARVA